VTVSEYVPPGVFFHVDTVSVDVPLLVIELGLKVADPFAGSPLTRSPMVPAKPFTGTAEIA